VFWITSEQKIFTLVALAEQLVWCLCLSLDPDSNFRTKWPLTWMFECWFI